MITNGRKFLSNEEEKKLVERYINGEKPSILMVEYGYKTKKSITDKVKKYYPDSYEEKIELARSNRINFNYSLKKISSDFDAYFVGLLLTDGYIARGNQVGIDLADEDCIAFLAKVLGVKYHEYDPPKNSINEYNIISKKKRYRLIVTSERLVKEVERYGIIPRKSLIVPKPILFPEEEKFIPYIIRGIIDGDGTVCDTSYGGSHFNIITASKDFAEWIQDVLTNRMYMQDINIVKTRENLYSISSANQNNILKLILLSYDKPFGMARKYEHLRKTFRDYNSISDINQIIG